MKFVAIIGTDLDAEGAREITITVPEDQVDRFMNGEAVQAAAQIHTVRKLVAPRDWCTCGAKTPQGEHHKIGCPARERAVH